MTGIFKRGYACLLILVLTVAGLATTALAQDYGARLGTRRGGTVTFEPQGSGVLFDALDPAVKRWYVPQELYNEYRWKSWEYSNYARVPYQRYVNTALEGDYFYDVYGNYVTRGWLIYDWRQEANTPQGSSIYQDANYRNWFSSLVVASDSKGSVFYSLTVGDDIRTTLTPLTFSKPRYNGIQLDAATDKYAATLLFSRANSPINGSVTVPDRRTSSTNLIAGRVTAQVGDFVTVGGTLVNAHNSRSSLGAFSGNSFKGTLAEGQGSSPVTAIALILSDDSPEDGEAGAALFSHDVKVVRQDFQSGTRTTLRLADLTSDPTRWPIIEGGFFEEGFLSANGRQRMVINYDFTDPAYIGPDPSEIVEVAFELILANDFRVQVWSDRQTGQSVVPNAPLTIAALDNENPALLEVAQATGNVKDGSNRQRVAFDYGLPTANQIAGFTIELTDVKGLDVYAEYDVNHRFRQYPNAARFNDNKTFSTASSSSEAWIVNASYQSFPWFFFGEAFSMDRDYSTSAYIVNILGDVVYDRPSSSFYEFVDDNDDQDRYPDWQRPNQGGRDLEIFPGWDENNDFVSDFNQNDNRSISNRLPDYEEPFLRYTVDRPEFLFGIDLNNNGWIDRFENDDEQDFPYKRDHNGYNAYGGANLTAYGRVTVGQTRQELLSSNRKNNTTYGLVSFDRDYSALGRLRIYDMLKRVEDNIPDDRFEPQAFLLAGAPRIVPDIVPAPDTWVNTLWLGFDYRRISNLNVVNKVKLENFLQQDENPRALDGSQLNSESAFYGVVNRADYTYSIGTFILQPRIKSEYLRQTAFLKRSQDRKEWRRLVSLTGKTPVLRNSQLELGLELMQLADFERDEQELLDQNTIGPTGDLNETNLALQWSTRTDYQGYKLLLQTGFRLTRAAIETIEIRELETVKRMDSETTGATFLTIYAGLE